MDEIVKILMFFTACVFSVRSSGENSLQDLPELLEISSSGQALEDIPQVMGIYRLSEEAWNGYPTWTKTGSRTTFHIFVLHEKWSVGDSLQTNEPIMESFYKVGHRGNIYPWDRSWVWRKGTSFLPPVLQENNIWQYRDSTLTIKIHQQDKSPSASKLEPWEKNIRLPNHLIPLHYDLHLYPELESGLFTGNVTVEISALEPTNYFLTHVKDLEILETRLRDSAGANVDLAKAFEYPQHEFWVVVPNKELPKGNYSLFLEFSGSLTKGITGFYKSTYLNGEGKRVPIATSKFQPTYARRAFPCFDEPSFKSTFSLSLVRPSKDYIALSNMPSEREETDSPGPGLTTVFFQKSVPMVTYLACFIVCDFNYQEKLTDRHATLFRVYATPHQNSSVKYALDIGANITDYFTDYFDIPYPLPKQDMIAIPDFVSGAMEHWGLITYRETNLLYDPLKSSTSNRQRVATVVSHELAHQWFGNLVTLDWWDDLWLNEGFASYMEYKGVANYHDDWEIEDQFLTSDLHRVLDLDATLNSHPIVQEVSHPDQITEIFDIISYSKGASVLRMLENFIGPKEFQLGVHNFLEKYKYRNAITSDLWQEFESLPSASLPVGDIMDTWTKQMGYPILQVTKLSPTRYRLTQTRYLKSQQAFNASESPYEYKWDVPVTWISSSNTTASLEWLRRNSSELLLDFPNNTDWVKFNVGQYGFYRVNYPLEDWNKLANLLVSDPNLMSSTDRASLLNDAFSLAESGHLSYDIPLKMTSYLSKETNLVPWETVYNKLLDTKELLQFTPTFPLLNKYIQNLVRDHYLRLGWRDEGTHAEKLNRNDIISLACASGIQECTDKAVELFDSWLADPTFFISPNLKTAVLKNGMSTAAGSFETWSTVFERAVGEDNAQEKKKLWYGLAQVREPWILHRYLHLAQNETIVRSQDFFTVLHYISQNPVGKPIIWEYLQENWPKLVERFSLNDRYLGRIPKAVTAGFSSEFKLRQVQAFFEKYPEAGAGARARKQALESIQNNIKWLDTHQQTVHSWLEGLDL